MDRRNLTHKAQAILTEAYVLLQDREAEYGDAAESFERIAAMWRAYLGHPVSGKDVAAMMLLLKVSRSRGTGAQAADDFMDAVNYAAFAAELSEEAA